MPALELLNLRLQWSSSTYACTPDTGAPLPTPYIGAPLAAPDTGAPLPTPALELSSYAGTGASLPMPAMELP